MAKKPEQDESVNKMELVRQALQVLGVSAKPKEIQSYIQDQHNVEIPTTIISSYKSMIRAGKSGFRGRSRGDGSVTVEDIQQVKTLIHRMGPEQLTKLITTLSN